MSMCKTDEARILEAFEKLDGVEQLIFLSATRALCGKAITVQQFEERTTDLFSRYRAGQDVTVTDLERLSL